VIGGAHSNNTRELGNTCSRFCSRVHHVQAAADLRQDWFVDADVVGITAGTSTPDEVIDRVEHAIREWGARSGERAIAAGGTHR
jgi:4-hydroxy-3-methylbut-2-en-1-yl diphosphate reductase